MTEIKSLTAQARQDLVAMLGPLSESIQDLEDALRGLNSPEWPDRFEPSLELARRIVAIHTDGLNLDLADDMSGVRSQIARHVVPRPDKRDDTDVAMSCAHVPSRGARRAAG